MQANTRKLTVYIAMSLDGFIAKPGDDLSFLTRVEKEGEDYGYSSFYARIDTVIMGRKTYDWVYSMTNEAPHSDKKLYVFTRQTELAKEGIRHLGYPEYFGNALVVFKVLGVLAIVIPQVPKRVKEWAYAGFAFDFLFAAISHGAVDGINGQTFFPLVVLGILAVSYIYYHKLIVTN